MCVILYVVMLCFQSDILGGAPSSLADIQEVISRYRREITVLELGKHTYSYLPYLLSSQGVGAAIVVDGDQEKLYVQIQTSGHGRTALMTPTTLTVEMIEQLGRCEHFDVVIVHDITTYVTAPHERLIAALIALGDYVFLEAECPAYEAALKSSSLRQLGVASHYPSLFLSHKVKKHLELARYTQQPTSESRRYEVQSTYLTKKFNKKGLPYPLRWIHGINLVTFIMFQGIFPDDSCIRMQLKNFKTVYADHNDLVIGNLILQGTRLIPIDMDDRRRGVRAARCLTTALRFFGEGNKRLLDPQLWIDCYYQALP